MEPKTEPEPRRSPAIRTMKSDISEFLKTAKPSLPSILARQAQWEEYRTPKRRRAWPWTILLAFALAAVVGILLLLLGSGPEERSSMPLATPPPLLFFESASETTIPARRGSLLTALLAPPRQPQRTFHRIVLRIEDDDGPAFPPALGELVAIAGGKVPSGLAESAAGPPQLFRYQSSAGSDLGFVMEVKNPARALSALISAEPSLARDLELLLLPDVQAASVAPYVDLTYRNINIRYLRLSPDRDRGIGYLLFPSRNLIVMTTSEATLRAVVDRLFETR